MLTLKKSLTRLTLVSAFVAAILASPTFGQDSHAPQKPAIEQGVGDLTVLAVGVAKYAEPGHDLYWMDQDAKDHCAFWKSQEGHLCRHVDPRCFVNKDATVANVRGAMTNVEKNAKKGDTLIAPWHGHGGIHPDTGKWAISLYDDDIHASELIGWATRLSEKGVRVIFIFDSCHSGAMLNIDVPNVIVFASSQADETSLDVNGFLVKGNSLFTKVLFEALSGKADANGDGIVTLAEVKAYLDKHVPDMAARFHNGHHQHPGVCYGGLSPETPLVQVSK